MVIKTVEALEARRQLGTLLNEAYYGKRATVIRRAGQPMAALVPLDIFEALTTVANEDIELYTPARVKELLKADQQ
jgi:prevent-host-death family protein